MARTLDRTPRVLVAYGSKNGGTAGIAGIIGTTLQEYGLAADVRPAAAVRSVDGYSAVIIGGALYANHWHREARRFARRYATPLLGRPVWLFSSGPLDDSADTTDIPPVPQAAEAARLLQVRQHVTFGGQLTDSAKGFIARAMARNGRDGDFRNPERIRSWTRSIAATLQ
jgi:menaquinone-dependent protoporphyrinogen oxidase